jgi:hypothetical protein
MWRPQHNILNTSLSRIGFVLLIVCFNYSAQAQEEEKEKSWKIKGYIKEMPYFSYNKPYDQALYNNLIHNRLNFKWTPSEKISGAAEFRTRLFWGDVVSTTPDFPSQVRNQNERVNASITWFETDHAAMITNIERFWLEYKTTKWAFRAGRQRINWGIATTWNPNDLFNAFNFLDFDYEERPGSDAIKAQYFISEMSNIDMAISPSFSKKATVAAAKYFFNKNNYDYQFNVGWYHNQFTMGAGWAGSLDEVGFKGEMQYFFSDASADSQFNAVVEADYMFSAGWYVNGGFLYNSTGLTDPVADWSAVNFQLSPRNLMPTAYNALASVTKEITPLIRGSIGFVYCPGTNIGIVLPTFSYNVSDRWDLSIIWQSFYADLNGTFQPITYSGFVRAKWSF